MRKPTLDEADCQTGIFSQTITVPRTVHHQLREQCNWLACPTHSYTARHVEFTDIIDLSNTWSCTAYGSVFNLFSEAEPFAAISIAHRTHVFWRDAWGTKGRNLRPKGKSWVRALERATSPTVSGLGSTEHCVGSGQSPDHKYILERVLWLQMSDAV